MDPKPAWLVPVLIILICLTLVSTLLLIIQRKFDMIRRMGERDRTHLRFLEDENENLMCRIAKLEQELENYKQLAVGDNNSANQKLVFISYSHMDREIVLLLRQKLEQQGFPCYMAPDSIQPGGDYTIEIPNAICDSLAVVVALSSNSQASKWVADEVRTAKEEDIHIIPYQIDTSKLNRQFNFLLGQCQYIPFSDEKDANERANKELISRLTALKVKMEAEQKNGVTA